MSDSPVTLLRIVLDTDSNDKIRDVAENQGSIAHRNCGANELMNLAADSCQKKRILVIDDDPHFLKVLAMLLAKAGFEVIKAANGKEVFDTLENATFDLILSDIDLPDTTGLEICRRLSQSSIHQHIPVILMSGRLDDDMKAVALAAGAKDFVSKPFAPEFLLAKVDTHIGKC